MREIIQANGFMCKVRDTNCNKSGGDDNNTKEKGINVGMYLTLCGFEKLNHCVLWVNLVFLVICVMECQWMY